MPEDPDRDWLLNRIELAAQDVKDAEVTRRDMRLGRLLGFLEAGTHMGYWSKRRADLYGEMAAYGVARGKARRILRR